LGASRSREIAAAPIPPATTDAQLVALWLHGTGAHTILAYDDVAASYCVIALAILSPAKLAEQSSADHVFQTHVLHVFHDTRRDQVAIRW